jgi:hypothetical protein
MSHDLFCFEPYRCQTTRPKKVLQFHLSQVLYLRLFLKDEMQMGDIQSTSDMNLLIFLKHAVAL